MSISGQSDGTSAIVTWPWVGDVRRRRYLQLAVGGGLSTLAGCGAVPFFGEEGPLRGQLQRERPVAAVAAGPDGGYAVDVPDAGETALVGISLSNATKQWERDLLASGRQFRMWRRGDRLLAMNGRTLIVTEAGFSSESWRRTGATEPVIDDGVAYLRTVRGGRTFAEALRVETGSPEWSVQLESPELVPATQAPRALTSGHVILSDVRRPLRARTISEGEPRWETDQIFEIPIAATEESIYAVAPGDGTRTLHRVDPMDGRTTPLASMDASLVVPHTTEGALIVRQAGGKGPVLVGRDPASGSERWRLQDAHTQRDWLRPDGLLATLTEARLTELDPRSGSRRWTSTDETAPVQDIAWTADVVAVARAGRLVCRDRSDGQVRWRVSVPQAEPDAQAPAVAASSDAVLHAVGDTVRVYETDA